MSRYPFLRALWFDVPYSPGIWHGGACGGSTPIWELDASRSQNLAPGNSPFHAPAANWEIPMGGEVGEVKEVEVHQYEQMDGQGGLVHKEMGEVDKELDFGARNTQLQMISPGASSKKRNSKDTHLDVHEEGEVTDTVISPLKATGQLSNKNDEKPIAQKKIVLGEDEGSTATPPPPPQYQTGKSPNYYPQL